MRQSRQIFDHSVQIPKHLLRGNSNDPHALLGEPGIAPLVPLRIVAHVVGDTVDLDGKLGASAEEIQYIAPGRMLASELETVGTFPKLLPKQNLR